MAKKKPTAQQREIASLAKNYQASLAALGPEYENLFAKKQEVMSAYNVEASNYQTKLDAFSKQLAEYRKNPPEKKVSSTFDYNPYSNQVFVKVDKSWYETYPRNFLPAGYYVKGGGDYTNVYTKIPPPTFTEKAPAQPDLSSYDKELQTIESKKQTVQQTLERETTERRSARLRAVTQGSRERPMLSKGVTLNG